MGQEISSKFAFFAELLYGTIKLGIDYVSYKR